MRKPGPSVFLRKAAFIALPACLWLGTMDAWAQDAPARQRLASNATRSQPALRRQAVRPAYRDLTINRRPEFAPDDTDNDGASLYVDGPVRYNSIRTFNPVPYVDSARQFPYGLDGIGGYGSDLGFGADQDAAFYDRGP